MRITQNIPKRGKHFFKIAVYFRERFAWISLGYRFLEIEF